MMLNKKHNSKTGKKQRQGKEISKRKQDRKPKKENILMKKRNSQFNIFMFFSRNKSTEDRTKKRDKNKKEKESQKRKTRRKKARQEQNRETEKEKVKKGEAKKG